MSGWMIILFGILLPCSILGQKDRIVLSAANPTQRIVSASFLPDPEDRISIDDIRSDSTIAFTDYGPDHPGFSDTVRNYWLRFEIQNADSIDREWIFNFDGWSYVTFFDVHPDGTIHEQNTGHLLPVSQRDYLFANKCNLLVPVSRNETSLKYVHLQSRPDHVIKPKSLSFNASLRAVQDKQDDKDKQIISIFLGIYALMFFYNLFIYASTREKSYIFYLIAILSISYTTMNNAGYTVPVFGSMFDAFPHWRGPIESFNGALGEWAKLLFTITFLGTKENLPFWHKVLRSYLVVVLLLLIGVYVNYRIFSGPTASIALVIRFTYLVVGILSMRKHVPSAGYYLLAFIFQVAGTLVLILALLGVLHLNALTYNYAMPTGYALQMMFFSLALANRINILKKSNEESQERIIEHLRENERLQLRVTQELEEKVAQRTEQIMQQKEIIESEKERSEALLYNILPQPVAKELLETGATVPHRYEEVSILFTDFVDFTNISASIPAAKLVEELNGIFFLFDDIVKEHGLEKIKTIGDSYMAVSGLPVERADHAVQCVKAAWAMVQCLEDRSRTSSIKWNLRAGIHSGPVVAGVVGKQKFTFDLWGDTVNMASRMESNGLVGTVNISEYTYDLVRNNLAGTSISFAYRGKVSVKGKGEMDMYYIDNTPK